MPLYPRRTSLRKSPVLMNRTSLKSRRRPAISNISFPTLSTIKRILLLMIFAVILIFGIYAIFFSGYLNVQKIYIEYDEFQNENDELLNYFENLKGGNILFVDTEEIKEQISKEHPELQKLTTKKIFPSTLQVTFSEFPITANIEHIENGKSLGKAIINSVGMAMYIDSENPNLPYIKVITKKIEEAIALPAETAAESEVPTPVVAPEVPVIKQEHLNYILGATKYYEEKFGMKVVETQFLPHARELHLKTEKYFFIWLDIQVPFEREFLKLKKIMANIDIYKDSLEYIDLRISGTSGEKVIFKRKK